jgi:plasmanylethanolamine desaturase
MTPAPTAEPLSAAPTAGKARTPHLLEYVGVIGFFTLCALLAARVYGAVAVEPGKVGWVLGAVLAGYVMSDFVSGLVHWGFDTWGSPDTPVLGKNFIIPFRVHHSDPKDITLHGFVATNGHNCLACIPVLGSALLVPVSAGWAPAMLTFLVSLCMGVFATNQFHKWAHFEKVGPVIRLLQRLHLVLPEDHHDVHHHAPYEDNYCITSGWLNAPLRAIGFFRRMERLITAVTGVEPRKDDLKDLQMKKAA